MCELLDNNFEMAENFDFEAFYEVLQWPFNNTKLDEDAFKLSKMTEEAEVARCINSRKVCVTRCFSRVKNDEEYSI